MQWSNGVSPPTKPTQAIVLGSSLVEFDSFDLCTVDAFQVDLFDLVECPQIVERYGRMFD